MMWHLANGYRPRVLPTPSSPIKDSSSSTYPLPLELNEKGPPVVSPPPQKMPLCDVSKYQQEGERSVSGSGIKIFYQIYGRGRTKVLLIIGLAGTHDSWGPQIKALAGTDTPNEVGTLAGDENVNGSGEVEVDDGIEVCAFDNRGMGRSSIPTKKSEYKTTIMAKDTLALMDHLGWSKAHVFGHSMGAMIACKLAALVPQRISSLALLNVTGGGFECLPKFDRQVISIAIRFLRARTPEQRAAVDLDTHYTKEYLDEYVGTHTRRKILYQEYVKGISSTGMQSNHGFEGQVNACWTHKLTSTELEAIRSGAFLISVIHGRYDIIAQMYYARKLAQKLQPYAKMVELHGGHLVSHERPEEVNQALMDLIQASESNPNPHDWSNLAEDSVGWQTVGLSASLRRKNNEGAGCFACIFDSLAKSILYLFGLIIMAYEHGMKILRSLKPVRIGTSLS